MKPVKPVALIILDGWGIREKREGNAIAAGNTPNHDGWLRTYERSILDASGEAVGLPAGQMGNSEVGHLNLGAGRIVYQDLTRVQGAISDSSFYASPALEEAIAHVKQTDGKLHLIGLLGEGGVHSHIDHLYALMSAAKGHGTAPIIHLITDGRDTPPESSLSFLEGVEAALAKQDGLIASVSGRYYTMDRDKRWERIWVGYELLALHQGFEGRRADSARAAITAAHAAGITDEFIPPTAIDSAGKDVTIQPGDSLVFYNFRADRMRQIVSAFSSPTFDGFPRTNIPDLEIVTMTNYDESLPVKVMFPDVEITNTLAQVLSQAGKSQFHAAETEKYAHVTYFFNGGLERLFPGEERHLEPSPKVATYDLQPEMSAEKLTDAVVARLASHDDDFVLVNYANPDMVGHTGDLEAAVKAVEAVDRCAGTLVTAICDKGGVALVTADHGNCERMVDLKTGEPHTYHTTQPVSFLAIGLSSYVDLQPRGILADVAPTILDLMNMDKPAEMSGRSLLDW